MANHCFPQEVEDWTLIYLTRLTPRMVGLPMHVVLNGYRSVDQVPGKVIERYPQPTGFFKSWKQVGSWQFAVIIIEFVASTELDVADVLSRTTGNVAPEAHQIVEMITVVRSDEFVVPSGDYPKNGFTDKHDLMSRQKIETFEWHTLAWQNRGGGGRGWVKSAPKTYCWYVFDNLFFLTGKGCS